jgi:hypothetical protein
VEFYSLIILREIDSEVLRVGAVPVFEEGPPPPYALKVLLGAGFAKQPLQNLERKRLKDQNLDNKGLASINFGTLYNFRLDHDGLIADGWQGYMSHEGCGSSALPRLCKIEQRAGAITCIITRAQFQNQWRKL